jgi:Rrf2 family protein
MISRTAEYALRAMVHLAATDDPSQTVGQIAAGTRVPAGYLAKVLQSLSRAHLIISQRGLGGGFRLAKPAGETSIYEVIQAVDPMERIHECPLGLEAHGTNLCPLHRRLDDAMALIEEQFRATMIVELVEESATSKKRVTRFKNCAFPCGVPAPAS